MKMSLFRLTLGLVLFVSACESVGLPPEDLDGPRVSGDRLAVTADSSPLDLGFEDRSSIADVGPSSPDAAPPTPDAAPPAPDASLRTGDGLFARGCPERGRTRAYIIDDPAHRPTGAEVLAGPGDVVLMNSRAAFVVQGPEVRKTWWYYGGGLIDVVPVDGDTCRQAGEEHFGELAVLLGEADLGAFDTSTLRGFAADRLEVISDGRDGGEARVRVIGHDDRFWLVELELMKRAAINGGRKLLSEPMGIEVSLDYVLRPDESVLRLEATIVNRSERARGFQVGLFHIFGDATEVVAPATGGVSIGGLGVRLGLPYLGASARDGSLAIAMLDARQGAASVSGVDVLIDVDEFLVPRPLPPGEAKTRTFFVAAGPRGLQSAVTALYTAVPETTTGITTSLLPLDIEVRTAEGLSLPGAEVRIERPDGNGGWLYADGGFTDETGVLATLIPTTGEFATIRLRLHTPGRTPAEPTLVRVPDETSVQLLAGPLGTLGLHVLDAADDGPLPAKLTLFQAGVEVAKAHAHPDGLRLEVPPGHYEFAVTRGYEWAPSNGEIDVPEDGQVDLTVSLAHVVDTLGFLSTDGHVHAAPSPDSTVPMPLRVLTAAAEGLDVLISTDHEIISDWNPAIDATGLRPYVSHISGIELTPSLPEHLNAYPLVQGEGTRGGFPIWYGLSLGQIFELLRDRGAGVIDLNHPRNGCNYLCVIDYDRLTGQPRFTDASALGLPEGTALFSFGFDTLELMNGHTSPFVDNARPRETGVFEDWMSFLNFGHWVTATAVTDTHGLDGPGDPRTYFAATSERSVDFDEQELTVAMQQGRALISSGGFARVNIGDAQLGDTAHVFNGAATLDLTVTALPEIDVQEVLVLANCDEVARLIAPTPDALIKLQVQVPLQLERDAHIVVMGFGRRALPRGLAQFDPHAVPRFVTNAIFVDADHDGVWAPPGGKTCTYVLPD